MSLDSVAYELCNEIREGKWDHILDPRIKQPAADPKIIEELRRRCPGCSVQQYQQAIAKGMFESLW